MGELNTDGCRPKYSRWPRWLLAGALLLYVIERRECDREMFRLQLRAMIAGVEAESYRAILRARAPVPAPCGRPWWRPPVAIAAPMAGCLLLAAVCFALLAVFA